MNLNQRQNNYSQQDNRNSNSNQNQNPNQSQQFQPPKPNPSLGLYSIIETGTNVYIKHEKTNKVITMDRNLEKIRTITDYDEILNLKYISIYNVDSILGILDIYNSNKYLIVVISSKIAAKFKGSYIYNIHAVKLVRITLYKETEDEKKCSKEIVGLFATRNFYYSNDYDLSLSLNNQEKNINNHNYLINLSLLKNFKIFDISNIFYSYVIFGYVGCKIDVEIKDIPNGENKSVDIIIIERVYKKNLFINDDIQQQLKQIELITVYKTMNKEEKIFSLTIFLSNELFYQNIKGIFNPYNDYIKEEIDLYNNIICIINDIYIIKNNNSFVDFIHSNDELSNKTELINLTTQWKKNLYFESNQNCDKYITSYISNSNINQEKIFWFIDINNNMVNEKYCNDLCFNAIVRILWIAIQKQMNTLGWRINIGLFHAENKRNISIKFKDIIMPYNADKYKAKKYLYNPKIRNLIQVVYDFCFNGKLYNSKNMYLDNKNNVILMNNNSNNNKSIYNFALNNNSSGIDMNYEKLNILCITWNVCGLSIEDNKINIDKLFIENNLYKNKIYPDIIFIGLQEIIELKGPIEELCNIDTTQKISIWTDKLSKCIENIYSNIIYYPIKVLDIVGIYFICFAKYEHKPKINLIDFKTTKTGFDGKYGNKGFITMCLQYQDNYIVAGSGHLEAGEENNKKRMENLKELLNTKINLGDNKIYNFKDIDFWIFLGDANFRLEMDYKDVIGLIEKKNLNYLLKNDQFYKYRNIDNDYNLINEGNIYFKPTYKFIKGFNDYEFNENKIQVPSWTDRIFYVKKNKIKNIMYNSIDDMILSDHKPVIGVFEIFCRNQKIQKIDNPYISKNKY